jgi:hypothetical protein
MPVYAVKHDHFTYWPSHFKKARYDCHFTFKTSLMHHLTTSIVQSSVPVGSNIASEMAAAITTGHPTSNWRDETQGWCRHPSTWGLHPVLKQLVARRLWCTDHQLGCLVWWLNPACSHERYSPNHYWASTVRDSWLDAPWGIGCIFVFSKPSFGRRLPITMPNVFVISNLDVRWATTML